MLIRPLHLPLLAATVPLLLGGLVYCAFRPTTLIMFDWFDFVGTTALVTAIRDAAEPMRFACPDYLIYSFPQAAWVWFGTVTLSTVWEHSRTSAGAVWVLAPTILAVAAEVAQRFLVLPGTFDFADVGFSILALVAALWFCHLFLRDPRA